MTYGGGDYLGKYTGKSGSGNPNQGTPGVAPPPPKSDGHTYDIQNSPNESGMDWFTVDTYNNYNDAGAAYADYLSRGGYWQLLKDGKIISTNLSEADRFHPGVEGQTDTGAPSEGTAPNVVPLLDLKGIAALLIPLAVFIGVVVVAATLATGPAKELS